MELFASLAHRHPFYPWRGNDRKLHKRVQRAGPLGCLLDAWPSLPGTQNQEPPETLHLRALPGEGEPGTHGEWERQAGWWGAPVAPPAVPQCLFQQRSRHQSGLPFGGDAPQRRLGVPAHLPHRPHPETRNLPVRGKSSSCWCTNEEKIHTHTGGRETGWPHTKANTSFCR